RSCSLSKSRAKNFAKAHFSSSSARTDVKSFAQLRQVPPRNNSGTLVVGVDHGFDARRRSTTVKITDRLNGINHRAGRDIAFQSFQSLGGKIGLGDQPGGSLENRVTRIRRRRTGAMVDDG